MPVSDAHREALRSALAELELEETRLRDQFAELATRLRRATRLAARFGSAHATLRTPVSYTHLTLPTKRIV